MVEDVPLTARRSLARVWPKSTMGLYAFCLHSQANPLNWVSTVHLWIVQRDNRQSFDAHRFKLVYGDISGWWYLDTLWCMFIRDDEKPQRRSLITRCGRICDSGGGNQPTRNRGRALNLFRIQNNGHHHSCVHISWAGSSLLVSETTSRQLEIWHEAYKWKGKTDN